MIYISESILAEVVLAKTTEEKLFDHSHKRANAKVELIPPPPPSQPSLLLDQSSLPWQFDFSNPELLGEKHKQLQRQLKEIQALLQEKITQMQDKKDRFERFGPLYQEGVVSRHELEAAERESLQSVKDVEKVKEDLHFMESQNRLLNERIVLGRKQLITRKSKLSNEHSLKKSGANLHKGRTALNSG